MSQENRTESLLTECTEFLEPLLEPLDGGLPQKTFDTELLGFLCESVSSRWPNTSLKFNYRGGDNYLIINHPENPDRSLYIDVYQEQFHVQDRFSDKSSHRYRWTSQKVFSNLEKNIDPLLQEIEKFLSDTERNR
ncbi:MAG: hypothetical protein FGM23_04055 [Alphaproteobacteria bacterium]|nr:hypothetical protein [Alphaproteobacteria bacterium]